MIEGDAPTYLFGALHLLDRRIDERDPIVTAALDASEIFVSEAPLDLASRMRVQMGMMVPGGQPVLDIGEPRRSLTRAFMVAGAPRVLCSLWKVDDAATRALMTHFYEHWNPTDGDGMPAARALREAQAEVRGQQKWKHPHFWAAWVLWGLP